MSLQDILKKILDKAKTQVLELEKEAEDQKKSLKKESDEKLAEDITILKEKSKQAAGSVDKKIESMARRENTKRLLEVKNEVIQDSLAKFFTHIETSDDELYGKIIEKLFEPLKDRSGRVFVSKKRLSVTQKYAPQGCSLFEDENINGGFIFRGIDTEVDNTFENLVYSEFKQDLIVYIADNLKFI